MKFHVKQILLFLTLFIGSFLYSQTEFKIPDRPSKIFPVNDYSGILTSEQIQQLNQKLIAYSDSTSTEIVVCLIKTLDGDDINYVGARWGEEWKIGKENKNNGIILLIATQDRKLAIQTGRGTEDVMTDMRSGIIIRDYMIPYLKQNDFYGAVNSGTNQIIKVLQGKFKAEKSDDEDEISGIAVALVIFFFILFLVFLGNNSNKNTYYDRNGKKKKNDDDFWGGFGSGGGFFGGGGFGGGSSGGGFGGFGGGGSFGGGGASGSW